MKRSRRYRGLTTVLDPTRLYPLAEAVALVKKSATAKFDETVDVSVRLGIDPKKQDQAVRGSCVLPFGTGKKVTVLAICRGEKEAEAKAAGADHVGFEEYLEKIKGGWFDFDYIVATPEVMPELGKLGKILGTKGLMPSPKTGTVTFDIGPAVKSLKAGKINFKTDKTGNIQTVAGKVSFEEDHLIKNILAILAEVSRLRPASVKGQYIRGITISSTMGPGFALDPKETAELLRKEG